MPYDWEGEEGGERGGGRVFGKMNEASEIDRPQSLKSGKTEKAIQRGLCQIDISKIYDTITKYVLQILHSSISVRRRQREQEGKRGFG